MVIHYRARGTVHIGKMFIWSGGGGEKGTKQYELLAEVMGGQRASRDEGWIGRGGVFFCCYCWTSEDICCIVGQWSWGILGLGMNTEHH